MLAVVAAVFAILGIVGILPTGLASLWALLFIALGIAFGWYPFSGNAPWGKPAA